MKRMFLASLALAALIAVPGCEEGAESEDEATEAVGAAAAMAAPGEDAELVIEGEGLLERARVSDGEARVAALVKVSGGRIARAVLEEEDGRLVYAYDLVVETEPGVVTEVLVDAVTAEVVSIEKERAGN